MKNKIKVLVVLAGVITFSSIYALNGNVDRAPVEFYNGHTHTVNGHTDGAPQHSGGTDRWGCHNRSVPYHCHNKKHL
mgnify:CR=1 FL=1